MLAPCPGNRFDLYAAGTTIHPTHTVNEEDRDSPQRHIFETPSVFRPIVSSSRLIAVRTDRPAVATWLDFYQQTTRPFIPNFPFVNKRLESLDSIEDNFQVHPVLSLG